MSYSFRFALLLVLSSFFSSCSNQPAEKNITSSYTPVSQDLYNEISQQDSLLFNAFNDHNTEKLMSFFTADLEFYHDKGGVSDFQETMLNFKNLFDNNKETGLRRDLVHGSMEVYPIQNFGAIATSLHQFCHQEDGKDDCGTFKNIMIWKKEDSSWKVSRVISYDH